MKKIALSEGDFLIIDPCYLTADDKEKLTFVKSFAVDDGDCFVDFEGNDSNNIIGVDSGQISIFQYCGKDAIEIEDNSGLSGFVDLPPDVDPSTIKVYQFEDF